jgi:uncharacterized protein (TIGR03000 family)
MIAFATLACGVLIAGAYAPQAGGQAVQKAEAEITILVPADAEIFFNGNPTTEKGPERVFVTPPLVVGKKSSYEVLARWKDAGKVVQQSRKVEVSGGARVRVNFLAPPQLGQAGQATQISKYSQDNPKFTPTQSKSLEDWSYALALDAATYGSPAIIMYLLRYNDAVGPKPHAPPNKLWRMEDISTPELSEKAGYVLPNCSVTYGFGFLDLRQAMIESLSDPKAYVPPPFVPVR